MRHSATSISVCAILVSTCGLGQSAWAQGGAKFTISTPLRANPIGEQWHECSIGVSQLNPLEAMVAAIGGPGIGTTSIIMLPSGVLLEHGYLPCGDADSWVSGEPGAVGPAGTGPVSGAAVGIGFGPASPPWTLQGLKPYDNSGGGWTRWGAVGVVLDGGRLVAVLRDHNNEYNFGRPYIVWSDDDGATWSSSDGTLPLVLDPDQIIEATTIGATDSGGCSAPQGGDTPLWVDRRKCAPSIAVDHAPEPIDHVYVAFSARSAADATNTDIYIARSIDGGATWPSGPLNILQLTDAMLGLTDPDDTDPITGVDQFVPAIAVDSCGGIDLMFYDDRADSDRADQYSTVDVYFARVTGFGTPNVAVETTRLTAESFPADHCTTPAMEGFLGDYHNMAASADGRWLWLAYIARVSDPVLGWSGKNCYVHRVHLNCLQSADFNADGAVTPSDAAAFAAAWSIREPEADADLNWTVDPDDLVTYIDWYQSESGGR
ncbi:MAG: exo-alpha-sialidase [Phycisphaerales bacterium]|nr:exo-alpha-sialidase [Phycisphaerales bacterium]